jgi:probable rRNA maturation factor
MILDFREDAYMYGGFDLYDTALSVINASLKDRGFPFDAEVGLTMVDDRHIHALNKKFRGVDSSTDVLSFPMLEYPAPGDFSELGEDDFSDPEDPYIILGDIVISVDHVETQALKFGHGLKREYAFLIAHSMLHLMGYDHMTDETMKEMENIQERILSGLGIERE